MAELLAVMSAMTTAITLFQQCNAGFKVFTSAKSFREDGDTIRCMLEWEEYRFKRWGEASGLPSYEESTSKSEVANGNLSGGEGLNWELVSNTLRVLSNLLHDSNKLKTRYRMEISDDDSKSPGNDPEASSRRMRKLFKLPSKIPNATDGDRPEVGLVKRISWALSDKEVVQKLVTDISGLNDHLMALLDLTWQKSIQNNLSKLVEEAETRAETAEDRAILRTAMQDSLRDQQQAAEERKQNLWMAIYNGNLEDVEVLFASGASHDYRWSYHTSPLGRAVELKQLDITRWLLENDAPVNRAEYITKGITPFLQVATDGSPDMFHLLLKYGAQKAAVDGHARNAVHIAAENNNVSVLKELLKDPFFRDRDCIDGDGITPFQAAAKAGNLEILRLLFEYYPGDLNRAKGVEYYVPPLILAVAGQHTETVKFLLSCPGIDVNVTSHAGSTALTAAAARYDSWDMKLNILEMLRKAGANINHQDQRQYNALAQAVVSYNPQTVARLLTWDGIDINGQSIAGSPLCIAAQKGRKDMLQMLLKKKPDLRVRDENGKTALVLAAEGPSSFDKWYNKGRLENEQTYKIVCRHLLKAGLPIEDADSKGRTPLITAADSGHALIVQFLLEQGAYIDAEDEDGETALDFAKLKKHSSVVEVLNGHLRETWVCSRCRREEKR